MSALSFTLLAVCIALACASPNPKPMMGGIASGASNMMGSASSAMSQSSSSVSEVSETVQQTSSSGMSSAASSFGDYYRGLGSGMYSRFSPYYQMIPGMIPGL